MIDRIAEGYLSRWYHKKHRKPLVLRGARQVGKSTLVRQFARKHKLQLHEINLERHLDLNTLFQTLNIPSILRELESLTGSPIRQPDSVLFLDEIQATPYALQALRYFYEDTPQIPVIAAGSLLEFMLSDHSFPMPVGRIEYYHLGPLTFREFLQATASGLTEFLTTSTLEANIPSQAHKQLLTKQREFLFTGGMPEAVQIYAETGSVIEVAEVHRSIAETYQDDFSKYARHKELALMQRVFRMIPALIGHKVKYSNIAREQRAKDIKIVIELLTKARICHKVFHSHCSGVPLLADMHEQIYKLLFMDIGIVNHICGLDIRTLQALTDHELINEGALAEQFIGQHLLGLKNERPELCYWLREGKASNAEVDYVIAHRNQIVPIEVKSGKSGSLKSLQQFVLHKQVTCALRFDLNRPSWQYIRHITSGPTGKQTVAFNLLSLPLYLVEECIRFIELARERQAETPEEILKSSS